MGSTVHLVWSPRGRTSPLSTDADAPHGKFSARLAIPAAPPGSYEVRAQISDRVVIKVPYTVASNASVRVDVAPNESRHNLVVRGSRFVPHERFSLHALLVGRPAQPVILGSVRSDKHGRFVFYSSTTALQPGQYVLRVLAVSTLATQVAEGAFEVVL